MNDYYVYVYLDPRKQGNYKYGEYKFGYEPFYIGKGCEKRYREFKSRNGECLKIIKEISKDYIEPLVIILFSDLSESEAFERESDLIDKIGKFENGGTLVNQTGESVIKTRRKHSTFKLDIGIIRKLKLLSIETEKTMSMIVEESLNFTFKNKDILNI